jgi:adenosine deaminase
MLRPLADLHRHLDGSLRPETLVELAVQAGVRLSEDLRFRPGIGLAGALTRFSHTLAVLQRPSAVRRVASEICEDAAGEGVATLEIRFAPQLHRTARVEAFVDAALEGAAGRAGLILCGLYGEPPEVLDSLVEIARSRAAVVGIDLAGGPSAGRPDYGRHARAFARARDLGLGRTVHAAEGRPPSEIRDAIEILHAQRIGHGTTLLEDPAIVDLVIERGVTLEACPTSNVHTGALPSVQDHPLPRWLDRGVRACVCSDNTFFSDTDAVRELERAARIPGMDESRLRAAIEYGHAAAFRTRA